MEQYFSQAVGVTIDGVDGVPDDLYIHYLATTFTEVCKWWFDQGLTVEPETVLEFFSKLAPIRYKPISKTVLNSFNKG